MDLNGYPLLTVLIIATLSSMLAELPLPLRVPIVVWEMVLGMLVGPHVLGYAHPIGTFTMFGQRVGTYTLLEERGLSALFFMAGFDLDLARVRGRPLELAIAGWGLSVVVALAAAAVLQVVPFVHAPLLITLALSTTALGTFMPSLRDAGLLETDFGTKLMAAGAVGEFFPIIATSLVLTREFPAWEEVVFMLGFVAVAVLGATVALGVRPPRLLSLLRRTLHSSSQLPVLLTLVALFSLAVLSQKIGLESVLGAFSAGMILRLASDGEQGEVFREKIDAICFGFLVPFFFVVSGMKLDVNPFFHSVRTMLLIPTFLVLYLIVRGLPVLLYRDQLAPNERLPFALYSATALPLVLAITNIGVTRAGMSVEIATAMVGAAILSVLLFPALAQLLLKASARPPDNVAIPVARPG
ncbi:MAG TPA: cation:proton antiporter [Candidatus Binataceae bacterium]|nr:cation:proton antiporter [Candidatus Binataceae bacterium]